MQRSARSEIVPLPLTPSRAPADACRSAPAVACGLTLILMVHSFNQTVPDWTTFGRSRRWVNRIGNCGLTCVAGLLGSYVAYQWFPSRVVSIVYLSCFGGMVVSVWVWMVAVAVHNRALCPGCGQSFYPHRRLRALTVRRCQHCEIEFPPALR